MVTPDNRGGLSVEVEGLDKLIKNATNPKTLARPITKGLRQAGLAVQREAMLRAPVDDGRLQGDIKIETQRRLPFPLWVKIGPKVFYAKFVEFGTGLFGPFKKRIRPRTAMALSWVTKGGDRVFARSTEGMRAQPFMRPALPAAQSAIRRIIRRMGLEITRGMARGK